MSRIKVNNRYFDMTTVKVSGFPVVDKTLWATHVRGVKYSRKVTPGVVRGANGKPIARTPGTQDTNCSMEVVYEAWSAFLKKCKAAGIDGLTMYDFDVTIDLVVKGNSSQIIWEGASIINDDTTMQHGSDGLVVSIEMWCPDISVEGVKLYPDDDNGDSVNPLLAA